MQNYYVYRRWYKPGETFDCRYFSVVNNANGPRKHSVMPLMMHAVTRSSYITTRVFQNNQRIKHTFDWEAVSVVLCGGGSGVVSATLCG